MSLCVRLRLMVFSTFGAAILRMGDSNTKQLSRIDVIKKSARRELVTRFRHKMKTLATDLLVDVLLAVRGFNAQRRWDFNLKMIGNQLFELLDGHELCRLRSKSESSA